MSLHWVKHLHNPSRYTVPKVEGVCFIGKNIVFNLKSPKSKLWIRLRKSWPVLDNKQKGSLTFVKYLHSIGICLCILWLLLHRVQGKVFHPIVGVDLHIVSSSIVCHRCFLYNGSTGSNRSNHHQLRPKIFQTPIFRRPDVDLSLNKSASSASHNLIGVVSTHWHPIDGDFISAG